MVEVALVAVQEIVLAHATQDVLEAVEVVVVGHVVCHAVVDVVVFAKIHVKAVAKLIAGTIV